MAVPKREARLKQIIQGLRHDRKSLANVKLTTLDYAQGKSTNLDEMAQYVRAHRPSSNLRAMQVELEHAGEMVYISE